MFDRLTVVAPRPVEHHTHVQMVDPSVEKGARFLDEVQTKAQGRVVNVLAQDLPSIDARLITYELEKSIVDGTLHQRVCFVVNGRTIDLRVDARETDIRGAAIKMLAEEVGNAVLRQISPNLLMKVGH